ncbi:MAG TPA: D-2-hydroxyacid dehydrogenase [Gammaproteobacteria bacterium]|nr:D-2-hydroxyacid dehydrogenase [Gammaproteobacteria bacterium]
MPAKPKAVFLDFAGLGEDVDTRALERLLDLRYYDYTTADEVGPRIAEAEIVIVNKTTLSASAIAGAPRLRLIALTGTGTDNVDTAAAAERGVALVNTRGYCSASVVQHVFALILALTQQIVPYTALVRSGAWQSSRSFALLAYPIRELAGRMLGVVGYGTLGRAVADAGRCFGMRVLVSARPGARAPAEGRVPFEQVLEQADVLTLHCPLDETTRHLIGKAELARMKRDALLINTARGGLVDGEALAEALRRGAIGGAGVDVLPVEPPESGDPLLAADVPNLIVTPHVAWTARESRQRALNQVAENVEHFLRGEALRRVL